MSFNICRGTRGHDWERGIRSVRRPCRQMDHSHS